MPTRAGLSTKSRQWGDWRKQRGLSQAELASQLEITRSYLSEIENGKPASPKLQARFHRLRQAAENPSAVSNAEIVSLRFVPLVSWAQAGDAVDYDELPAGWQQKVPTTVTDPKSFAVTIAGDSMEPRYHAGDVAFLEPSRPLRQHDTVIARIRDGGVVFKIYARTGDTARFSSYNPAYPPFEVPLDELVWAYPVHSVLKIVNR